MALLISCFAQEKICTLLHCIKNFYEKVLKNLIMKITVYAIFSIVAINHAATTCSAWQQLVIVCTSNDKKLFRLYKYSALKF